MGVVQAAGLEPSAAIDAEVDERALAREIGVPFLPDVGAGEQERPSTQPKI